MTKVRHHMSSWKFHYLSGLLFVAAIIGVYFSAFLTPQYASTAGAVAATGSIVFDSEFDFMGFNEWFAINDGQGNSSTFYTAMIDGSQSGNCINSSHSAPAGGSPPCDYGVIIDVGGGPDLAGLTNRIATAINATAVQITADSSVAGTVALTHDVAGASGNVAIVVGGDLVGSTEVAISGMSGGEDGGSAPTISELTLAASSTSAGYITVTATVADEDNDELNMRVEHRSGDCSAYTGFSSTTLLSAVGATDLTSLNALVGNANGFQFEKVQTTASNTLNMTWLSATDANNQEGTYCVYATAYDGTDYSRVVSSTIAIDNANPSTPGNLTVSNTSTTAMELTFGTTSTDSNFREYKIHYAAGTGVISTSDSAHTSSTDSNLGLSTITQGTTTSLSGLSPSTQYTANLFVYDTFGNTASSSNSVTFYTAPAAATGMTSTGSETTTAIPISINPGSNGTAATYAIYNFTSGNYIAADGSSSASPVYQTTSTWSGTSVTGLTANTGYKFDLVTRNPDGLDSATSTQSRLFTAIDTSTQSVATTTLSLTVDPSTPTISLAGTADEEDENTGNLQQIIIPDTIDEKTVVTLDMSRITNNSTVTTSNDIVVSRDKGFDINYTMLIPSSTTITSSDGAWDGQMQLPTVVDSSTVDVGPLGGAGVDQIIAVGLPNQSLQFSNSVQLVIPNGAGKTPFFITPAGNMLVISTVCNDATNPTNVPSGGECYIEAGTNMIIWTRHFTQFGVFNVAGGSYTPPAPPSMVSGGSGRTYASIEINSGATQTNNRTVTLTFNVLGAETVAISNSADFGTASFVPFAKNMEWELSEGSGQKTVYARFRTALGGIADESAKITLLVDGEELPAEEQVVVEDVPVEEVVEVVEDEELLAGENGCALKADHPYKTPGSAAVWLVTEQCTKKLFNSSKRYFSYFESWDDVTVVTEERLAQVPNAPILFVTWGPNYTPGSGSLLKAVTDPKVYFILGSNRHWISTESVFTMLNFAWSWIEDAAQGLIDKYDEGEDLTEESARPVGSLITYEDSPTIYLLDVDPEDANIVVKRQVDNIEYLKAKGFRLDRVVTVSADEQYPDGETIQ